MTSDGGKSFGDYVEIGWAWIKSRPANFLYGAALGFVVGAIFF